MRYEKAVRNCEKPQDVWLLYDVRILGTYSSYEVAKPKLKVAEEESDLNTDTEAKKHRKLKKKRVLSSSEDDEYDQLSSKLKPFPKVKILQTYDHEKNNVERDEITTPSLLQSLTPTASCSSGQDSRSVSSTDTFLSDEDFKAKVCHELSYIKINIIKLNQKITLLEDSSKQKNEPDENLTKSKNNLA
ncbi:hypothetical protein QE152_g37372 [Popillia japonica]|uniref:Uncharacterized protein n=1 Tax=Popillia japonica TaxID=7064 RepID=A0AAW1IAR3_POPJA